MVTSAWSDIHDYTWCMNVLISEKTGEEYYCGRRMSHGSTVCTICRDRLSAENSEVEND